MADSKEDARRRAVYDKYALAVGRANIAWNDVQSEIFHLFRLMSRMDWLAADAVFFAIRTDSAQRDMTAALAKHALALRPNDLADVLGTLNEVGKLAAERNAAIHTAWYIEGDSETARPYMRVRPPKAIQDDALGQFGTLEFRLAHLLIEINRLSKRLFPPEAPWSSLGILLPQRAAPAPNPPAAVPIRRARKPRPPPKS
jgi:hypothetical protein